LSVSPLVGAVAIQAPIQPIGIISQTTPNLATFGNHSAICRLVVVTTTGGPKYKGYCNDNFGGWFEIF
jgi:hypothetical protein